MQQHPLDLHVEALDSCWHEAFRLQLLALGLAEAGELVLARIAQGVRAVPTRCHQEPPDAIGLAEDDFIWTRKVVP